MQVVVGIKSRVMAVDGTVMDVPDSQENARVFGAR